MRGEGCRLRSSDERDGRRIDGRRRRAERSLNVELRTVPHVVTTYETSPNHGIDPEHIASEADISTALCDLLDKALNDGFEMDNPDEMLLAAIDEFRVYDRGELRPYAELGGACYAFEHILPTFAAKLADKEAEEYDEERVLREARERDDLGSAAIETFLDTLTAYGADVARGKYRPCDRPERIAAFLDKYDYAEDMVGVS